MTGSAPVTNVPCGRGDRFLGLQFLVTSRPAVGVSHERASDDPGVRNPCASAGIRALCSRSQVRGGPADQAAGEALIGESRLTRFFPDRDPDGLRMSLRNAMMVRCWM